jgi:hypothetical protein
MLIFHNTRPELGYPGVVSFARLKPNPNGPQNFDTQGNCLKVNSDASQASNLKSNVKSGIRATGASYQLVKVKNRHTFNSALFRWKL